MLSRPVRAGRRSIEGGLPPRPNLIYLAPMRLPPLPQLDWSDPSAPRSLDIGDVFFSGDGLAEKQAVFLGGCGLPNGWAGREQFTIGELGFGAGLSFLATWRAWRDHRPRPDARLHILSFENALMPAEAAARVHAAYPEIADLSARLCALWPTRTRGTQRIRLGDGVILTLVIDDVAQSLPQAQARIDAWFLDGFAPSKNPAMWSPETLAHVARLSTPGARAATYTVAGEVRRALEQVGFSVAKLPGVGRKKERLEATFKSSASSSNPPPKTAIVIGAGVAGATAARALLDRGVAVTVLDAGEAPGAGASGNPIALVMPRLDVADGPVARAGLSAWLAARRFWRGREGTEQLDARHLPNNASTAQRFARLIEDPPLDPSILSPVDPARPDAGLIHRGAIAIRPAIALPALLSGAALRLGARVRAVEETESSCAVDLDSGERLVADFVIVCAGMGPTAIAGLGCPPLEARLGQLEYAPGLASEAGAISDGGYVMSAGGDTVFGATFEPADGPPAPTPEARAHNLAVLARLRPDLAARLDGASLVSRAAIRATTPDRLPFAGAPTQTPQKSKALVGTPAPSGNIRLIGGLGSRGFLWAPLLAELVASEAFGEPVPLETSARAMLDPDRFVQRAARRRSGQAPG